MIQMHVTVAGVRITDRVQEDRDIWQKAEYSRGEGGNRCNNVGTV